MNGQDINVAELCNVQKVSPTISLTQINPPMETYMQFWVKTSKHVENKQNILFIEIQNPPITRHFIVLECNGYVE